MLIDVSVKPLRILIDECPGTIVVRSLKTQDADGRVTTPAPNTKNQVLAIKPVASLVRGQTTCMETYVTATKDLSEKKYWELSPE